MSKSTFPSDHMLPFFLVISRLHSSSFNTHIFLTLLLTFNFKSQYSPSSPNIQKVTKAQKYHTRSSLELSSTPRQAYIQPHYAPFNNKGTTHNKSTLRPQYSRSGITFRPSTHQHIHKHKHKDSTQSPLKSYPKL